MKPFNWNSDKNRTLIEERRISFEEVVYAIQSGGLLDDMSHPNQERYAHQRIFVVRMNDYAYLIPYIENDNEIFLKTIVPSRKATKQYLGEKK